jgi:hypothetical protein
MIGPHFIDLNLVVEFLLFDSVSKTWQNWKIVRIFFPTTLQSIS